MSTRKQCSPETEALLAHVDVQRFRIGDVKAIAGQVVALFNAMKDDFVEMAIDAETTEEEMIAYLRQSGFIYNRGMGRPADRVFAWMDGELSDYDRIRDFQCESIIPEFLEDFRDPKPKVSEEEKLSLRAGQAGKAAFLEALAAGKSRKEANEIAIAAADAVRNEDEAEF